MKQATARIVADSGPVTITASDDSESKSPRTFEAVAYSGGIVSRKTLNINLDADYMIDLAGLSARRSVKANLDHKPSQRVGHLTGIDNDAKQLKVRGALSAATPYREEVANSASDGFEWEVSIEADLAKPRKIEQGKTETVNGRKVSGPLYVFTKATLTGLGFVSNGADQGNAVSIAASAAGAKKMGEFEKFAASLGVDLDTVTDEQRANLQAAFDGKHKPTLAPTASASQALAELAEAERKEAGRVTQIKEISRAAMREHPMFIDQIAKLGDAAIESKMSADMFELELIRATRSKAGRFQAEMSNTHADPKVIEAAIHLAAGLPDAEKHYSEKTLDAVDRCGMRHNFSLQQLLMQVAHANGYTCRAGERITTHNIRAVLEHCFPPAYARLSSGFSTVSLPNVLGAVANKAILAGYMEEDSTWREIAQVKNVSNFYTQNHYRMLDNLEYEEVGSGGEIKHGTLGEETYTSRAKTYGKMLGLTRTQIINDDLGAFDDIRERLGRGAAQKFNNVFWAEFLDNSSFFTTARTNYIEGSTTNLGTDGVGLGLGVKAFRTMTTPAADGSKHIGMGLNPSKVLVPPELEGNAEALFRNQNLGAVASSSANIYANRYRPVVQWRLSNSSYTGYSTTAWYMFGDSVRPMLVTFLNGMQTPTVESTDADFDVLGILFRGYHDFGCDQSEYLAGIKSKGAA